MNKKKVIVATLSLSLSLGTSFLTFGSAVHAEQSLQDVQTEVAVSIQASQLHAFEELKGYFADTQVNLADVKKSYETKLQAAVKERNPLIDELISNMIDAGIKGEASTGQVKQAVDKGLQWFFYEEITYWTKTVAKEALQSGDLVKAKQALDKAITLFEGTIKVTAGKRDADFGTATEHQLGTVVEGLKEAVEKGNLTDYNVLRQYFDKTMIKVFVMGTSKYAQKVQEDHEGGKAEDGLTHMAEGYFFYMPIHNSMSGGSKDAAEKIKKAFESGDAGQVNGAEVNSHLIEALIGKVSGYVQKTFFTDLATGDKATALEHVAEGNAFVNALEVLVKGKDESSSDFFDRLLDHSEAYDKSVRADQVEEAKGHAFEVLKLLAQLKGVYFQIGDSSLVVNGQTVSNPEVVSYLDEETDRTLASARFVAEALGAKVEYVQDAQKIVIAKGDKTVEMTVGSKDVYVNGQKGEVQLDQPVVLKDGRAYIPVRAAAELLGGKVLYHDGKVVIH